MRYVEWIEPFGPKGEPAYLKVSEETAIAYQRTLGRLYGYEYASGADALDDFMVVHWAYFVEPPTIH